MAKFYGEKEIVDTKETTDGKQILVLEGGAEEVLVKKMVAASVTEEKSSPSDLRDKRCFPIVAEILKVMLEWDVKIGEIDFICQRVIMSINESLKKADEVLWKKERNGQTMSDVDRVLRS